jgi:hypothetical protein
VAVEILGELEYNQDLVNRSEGRSVQKARANAGVKSCHDASFQYPYGVLLLDLVKVSTLCKANVLCRAVCKVQGRISQAAARLSEKARLSSTNLCRHAV